MKTRPLDELFSNKEDVFSILLVLTTFARPEPARFISAARVRPRSSIVFTFTNRAELSEFATTLSGCGVNMQIIERTGRGIFKKRLLKNHF